MKASVRARNFVVTLALLSGALALAASAGGPAHATKKKTPATLDSAPLSEDPVTIPVPGGQAIAWIAADPASPDQLYGINQSEGRDSLQMIRSRDGGRTWTSAGRFNKLFFSHPDRIAVNAGGRDLLIATPHGAVVSTDGGRSFTWIEGDISDARFYGRGYPRTAGDKLVVSYGGLDNRDGSGIQLFTKQDGNWTPLAPEKQPQTLVAFAAAQRKAGACDHLDACIYGGDPLSRAVEVDPLRDDVIYAGTGAGSYRWTPEIGWQALTNKVLWDSDIYNLHVDRNGTLHMSSCNGIYEGAVDSAKGPLDLSAIKLSKVISPEFLFDSNGPLRVSPQFYRTYGVFPNESNPDEEIAVLSTGVYLKHDAGSPWLRVQTGPMDDRDLLAQGKGYYEYRTAVWLPDGYVVVSGAKGTFRFRP